MFVTKAKSIKFSKLNRILRYIYRYIQQRRGKEKDCDEEKRRSIGLLLSQNASMPQFSDSLQPYLAQASQVSHSSLCLLSVYVCRRVSGANTKHLLRVYLAPPRAGGGGGKKM